MFFCPSRLLHDRHNYTLRLDISTLHTVPPVYTKHINNINIIHVIRVYQKKIARNYSFVSLIQNHVWKNFFTSGINFYEVLERSRSPGYHKWSISHHQGNSNITCDSRIYNCNKQTNRILIEEHVKLSDTDSQICLVKLIRNIPAERTKLSPLLHQSVEETQTVQHLLQRFL